MHFFSELPSELARKAYQTKKLYDARVKEDAELGEISQEFQQLIGKTFYADMAFHEQGRVRHMMLKTTFESFQ